MSQPIVAEGDRVTIELLKGYFSEQFRINSDDDPRQWWQVFDRTTGQEVPAAHWSFDPAAGSVVIRGTKKWHAYTVNFFSYRIWEEISMYNHVTNDWGDREHLMPVEPMHPEAQEQVLAYLEKWLVEHPNTNVVRLTSLFYNFWWFWGDPQRTWQFRPFLRIARKPRRKPYGKPSRQGQILGKRSIDERPVEANERTRLGDWEGDTVVGKGRKGFLLTCVDRASRFLIVRKIHACAAEPVAEQLQRTLRRLPAEKRHSLTLDNGREFARPLELEKRLDLLVYFAHPYHSWERGTNENTNGLLRQYLPKGTDLTQVPSERLRCVVHALNHRPRKCLGFQSPLEVFHAKPSRSPL